MKQVFLPVLAALSFSVYAGSNSSVVPGGAAHGERVVVAGSFYTAAMPYAGKWSNGRGERLVITKRALRFNTDKPVTYRDVTKVTDGDHFSLRITTRGVVNYFTKFIALAIEGDEMKMTLYDSYEEMFNGRNQQGESTWYRDK